MQYSSLVKELPGNLQRRFWSLNRYVRSVVEEEEEGLPRRFRIGRDGIDSITTIIFAVTLSRFLHDGTRAAIRAVDAFEEVGMKSFSIGSAEFSERNENVMLGENLGQLVDKIIDDEGLSALLAGTESIAAMTITLREALKGE